MSIEERIGTMLGTIAGHTLRIAAPAIIEIIAEAIRRATNPTAEYANPPATLREQLLAKIPSLTPPAPPSKK